MAEMERVAEAQRARVQAQKEEAERENARKAAEAAQQEKEAEERRAREAAVAKAKQEEEQRQAQGRVVKPQEEKPSLREELASKGVVVWHLVCGCCLMRFGVCVFFGALVCVCGGYVGVCACVLTCVSMSVWC